MTYKSIILLSGGLDSLICLGLCKDEYNVELALTFDYGQKSDIVHNYTYNIISECFS